MTSEEWVAAVAVVNFDLELGQSIEHIEPPSFNLTEQERLNICYLAFPDSNSGSTMYNHDYKYLVFVNMKHSHE